MERGHPACRGCVDTPPGGVVAEDSEKEEEYDLLQSLLRFIFKYSGEFICSLLSIMIYNTMHLS
jgi:hypothetical protein